MQISDEAVEAGASVLYERLFHLGITMTEAECAVAPALEAAAPYLAPAVPQPVDREALAKRIERAIDASQLMGCGCCGGLYDYNKYESASEALAAQLADLVLAGEQEQVVPE